MVVQVLTDSTSYLREGIREELDIRRVSLQLAFADVSMREVDIDNEHFYPLMEAKGIPTSSLPASGEMFLEMARVIEAGDDLCCVFISSQMSGTLESAMSVREMVLEKYPQAHIAMVDSRANSMQLGYAVLAAARAAKAGGTLEQVVQAAEDNIRRSRFLFIPKTLEHLQKGGRIGRASALLGNLLQIIPVLTIENGVVAVMMKVRTRKNAIAAMVDQLAKDIELFGLGEVVIHHINCLPDAQELATMVMDKLKAKVEIVDIGPVVGMHVGPGAIGVVYYAREAMR
ncbi:MAG: DegV family protein [Armatimonadota bacterium]